MRGIYIHFPYCRRICPYCNFNKYLDTSAVASNAPQSRLADAFAREIRAWSSILEDDRRPITSVFFGGGSPSIADVKFDDVVLSAIRNSFPVAADCEVTMEVNPTDVEAEKLRDLRSLGVTRVSLGVQSFDDEDLQTLGRNHRRAEAIRAIESASAKFERVSVDLMYGLPSHRDAARFDRLLDESLSIIGDAATHLSMYALTVEEGTPFHQAQLRGDLRMPSDDESASMYAKLRTGLAGAGFAQYEISNFCRDEHFAQHNLNFWKGGEVIGIGPGAASRVRLGFGALERVGRALSLSKSMQQQWLKRRRSGKVGEEVEEMEERANNDGSAIYFAGKNLRVPERYISAVRSAGVGLDLMHSAPLDTRAYERELLLLGLRLVAGVEAPVHTLDMEATRSLSTRGVLDVKEVSSGVVRVRIASDMLALADEIALKVIR